MNECDKLSNPFVEQSNRRKMFSFQSIECKTHEKYNSLYEWNNTQHTHLFRQCLWHERKKEKLKEKQSPKLNHAMPFEIFHISFLFFFLLPFFFFSFFSLLSIIIILLDSCNSKCKRIDDSKVFWLRTFGISFRRIKLEILTGAMKIIYFDFTITNKKIKSRFENLYGIRSDL